MKNILSPSDYKKTLKKRNTTISKKTSFAKFKEERKKKFMKFNYVMGTLFFIAMVMPGNPPWAFVIAVVTPVIYIMGSPAIYQYLEGNLQWTNWIGYCLGICWIGIGFLFLFFFMPASDSLEKEYKDSITKNKK